MTGDEWAHMLRLACGTFGDNRLAQDTEAAKLWYASLQRFDGRVVFAAFTKLAETVDRFPKLAQVIEGCRQELDRQQREERDAQPKLAPGEPKPFSEALAKATRTAFAEAAENTRVRARREGASDVEVEEAVEQLRRRWAMMSPGFAAALGAPRPEQGPEQRPRAGVRRIARPTTNWDTAICGCKTSRNPFVGFVIQQICPTHCYWLDLATGRTPWHRDCPFPAGTPEWQRAREAAHVFLGLPAPAPEPVVASEQAFG